jgi:formylglycine-generating enzyme required for sulfatase activity
MDRWLWPIRVDEFLHPVRNHVGFARWLLGLRGSFPANAFGLHDMHGNLFEWCQDWIGEYPEGHVVDPQGPASGQFRVLRGGSWAGHPFYCRSACRLSDAVFQRMPSYGFRVCFSLA